MGFADALDVLGGNSSPPPPQDPTASSGNGPLRFTVHPRSEGRPEPTGSFGGALSILNDDATPEPPKETPKRDIGGAESFATGLKSGLTANFSDEIAGASAAGRSMLPDEAKNVKLSPLGEIIAAAGGAARMGYEALTGGNTGSDAYTKARDAERENQRLAAEQHPVANAAGNITGALALPIGGAASAATLPGRMAAGAGLGAGMGAAFGAGEGETLADRASRAGTGALIGGATGGVAPAILSGVGKAAGAVSDTAGSLLGHPIQTLRGLRNPDEEAARRVGTAIKGDMAAGRAGMSAVDARAAEASGQPLAVIDAGGENTRALARSAANTSPQGRAALEGMAQERFNSQNERTAEFARSLVPTPGNATRTAEAIDKAEAAANRPGYRLAYAAGDRPINSPEISRLMGSPDVVQAMKEAAEKGKSKAIADGFGAFNPGVKVTDDGQVLFQKGKGGVPTYPNIQFWDYTYRALRDKGRSLTQNGNRDEGNTLTQLSKQLRKELDDAVPEYGKARGVASEFFQAENALEAGQKFVGMRVPIEEAKAAHAKMTAPQKALFAEGFVSDLADKVSKIADNRSVVIDKIFNSPDGRARVELALGKDKAKDLEYFLRRESMMDMVRKAMGNSTTARQMAEMGLAGGLSGAAGGAGEAMMTGHMDAKTLLSAALVGGAVAGHRAINFKVAQRVGEMLASDDPKVLATALKMVKTNPDAGRAMIRAEKIMEKLSGQGAGSAPPMLPAISAGRADEQQQQ